MNDPLSNLPGRVVICPHTDDLFEDLGMFLLETARRAIEARQVFHLALSGGSTPEPFYRRLVTDPQLRPIPWEQTHLWIVDERQVPSGDEKSNFRMIQEVLVDHVPLSPRQVHPMHATQSDADVKYEAQLREILPGGKLDFVLLGMGDDAHTASLFPGSSAQRVTDRWVVFNRGPAVTPPDRLTMTYPLLNHASVLAVLVTGHKKAATLQTLDQAFDSGQMDVTRWPIAGINPKPGGGKLCWFLDHAAAGMTIPS